MKFKIALVQLKIDLKNKENTLKKVESYLKKAKGKADLIVFPEYVISWNILAPNMKKQFQKWAKQYSIDIVTGSMLAVKNKKVYNTAYYIDHRGKFKGTYQKINLWHPERPHVARGTKLSVFNTRFGKVALTICWDLAFPELHRKLVKKGAEIIISPAYWCFQDASKKGRQYNKNAELDFVNACCEARAFENEVIHVFCNAAGTNKEKNQTFTLTGRSQITVPFKGVLKRLNHNKEQMVIQQIDTKILKDAEKAYKIRKDIKNHNTC